MVDLLRKISSDIVERRSAFRHLDRYTLRRSTTSPPPPYAKLVEMGAPREEVVLRIDEQQQEIGNIPGTNEASSLPRNNSYIFEEDHSRKLGAHNGGGGGGDGGGDGGAIDPPTMLIDDFLRKSGGGTLDPGITFWDSSSNRDVPPPASGESPGRFLRSRTRSRQLNKDEADDDRGAKESPPRNKYARAASKSRLMDTPPPRSSEQKQQEHDSSTADEDDPLEHADGYPRGCWRWNFWAALQLAALVAMVGALVAACKVPLLQRRRFLGLELWRWAVVALVIASGRLLSNWIVRLLVMLIERNFMLRKRLLYFVYGLHKGVEKCLWFGIILAAWRLVFDPKLRLPTQQERRALEIVTKILVCLVVAAALWLLKILLVKVLALSFHVNTYFDRIQESLFHQYILETLSGPPVVEVAQRAAEQAAFSAVEGLIQKQQLQDVQSNAPTTGGGAVPAPKSGLLRRSGIIGAGNSDDKKNDPGFSIDHLQRLNQGNVSAWNMKRLIRLVRSSRITTLAHSSSSIAAGKGDGEITSEWEAKAAAKHIFKNVASSPQFKWLTLADFRRFLPDDEATQAFDMFDGAPESGKITKHALINWVVNVYRERRALSFSLNDTKTAVNKLHRIIDVIMGIIILIIWLLILEIATTHLLVVISSQLVLVAFVFGNTCKTVFEAIIFLFAMHPFDVGDRCVVDGVQMIVEEMNILTTVFLRYDNEKIYYPNSVLATKAISNFYRSPDMGDAIDFSIHMSTPNEKIEELKKRIAEYIDSHLQHWYPNPPVVLREVEDMNRMRMSLWLRHTMNHQDAGEKWIRRSSLLLHLKNSFQELGIDYKLLPQEVHIRQVAEK